MSLRAAEKGAEILTILFSLKSKKYSDGAFNYPMTFLNLGEEKTTPPPD